MQNLDQNGKTKSREIGAKVKDGSVNVVNGETVVNGYWTDYQLTT